MADRLLTVSEAARRLRVSRKIVQTLVDHGQLPSFPVGDRVRVPADAVEVYAELLDGAAALARRSVAATAQQLAPSQDPP